MNKRNNDIQKKVNLYLFIPIQLCTALIEKANSGRKWF